MKITIENFHELNLDNYYASTLVVENASGITLEFENVADEQIVIDLFLDNKSLQNSLSESEMEQLLDIIGEDLCKEHFNLIDTDEHHEGCRTF